MSYTAQSLVNDTYERLKTANPQIPPTVIPRLEIMVQSALRALPVFVREKLGTVEAEIYRKNYTVALSAGQGSLAAHTDLTSEPMIASEIVKVTHPDAITSVNSTGKLFRIEGESKLNLVRSEEFGYYAVEDNTLYTVLGNDRTALGGNATVRAAYPPLIANVKFSHEPLLLEMMIGLAQGAPNAA